MELVKNYNLKVEQDGIEIVNVIFSRTQLRDNKTIDLSELTEVSINACRYKYTFEVITDINKMSSGKVRGNPNFGTILFK